MTSTGEDRPVASDAIAAGEFVCEVTEYGRFVYWNHDWHVLVTSEFFALNQPAIDLGVCHFRDLVRPGDILAVLSAFKLSGDSTQNVSTEIWLVSR